MQYDESNIKPLEPRDHIRRRPKMYFGGVGKQALDCVIYEVIDHSVDLIIDGKCDRVEVALMDNQTISIVDNGPGISTKMHERGISYLELIFTQLGARVDRGQHININSGLIGAGISAINFVCEHLTVEVKCDGYLWTQRYQAGIPTTSVTQERALTAGEATGTKITLRPDFTIFEPHDFSYNDLFLRLRELAYLTCATFILDDQRTKLKGDRVELHYPNGVVDFLAHLNRDFEPLHTSVAHHISEEIEVRGVHNPLIVDIAFQYTKGDTSLILGFVNGVELMESGTHLQAFKDGFRRAACNHAENIVSKRQAFADEDLFAGLTAVVSIWYTDPIFEGTIRYKLINPEIVESIDDATYAAFDQFVEEKPDEARAIVEKCLRRHEAREARRFGR